METLGKEFLKELESEVGASRKCIERVPESLYKWKPHEKSMEMGYLTLLVAGIPKWITSTIQDSVIDFATWERYELTTTATLLERFDKNIGDAKKALAKVSDEELKEMFYLKNNERELFSAPKDENIRSSINHWVHHRGQLTVYMRLNDIAVPSIYGPSADEKTF